MSKSVSNEIEFRDKMQILNVQGQKMQGGSLAGDRPAANDANPAGESFGNFFARWQSSGEGKSQQAIPQGGTDDQTPPDAVLDNDDQVLAFDGQADVPILPEVGKFARGVGQAETTAKHSQTAPGITTGASPQEISKAAMALEVENLDAAKAGPGEAIVQNRLTSGMAETGSPRAVTAGIGQSAAPTVSVETINGMKPDHLGLVGEDAASDVRRTASTLAGSNSDTGLRTGTTNGQATIPGFAPETNAGLPAGRTPQSPESALVSAGVRPHQQSGRTNGPDTLQTLTTLDAAIADRLRAQIVTPTNYGQTHLASGKAENFDQDILPLDLASKTQTPSQPTTNDTFRHPVLQAVNRGTTTTGTQAPQIPDGPVVALADTIPNVVADRTVTDFIADPGKVSSLPMLESAPSATSASATTAARYETARLVAAQMVDGLPHQPGKPVEIALNPEELGRVRMILSTSDSGVSVSITTERPETLDLMRRHADQLAAELRRMGHEEVGFEFNGGSADGFGRDNNDGSSGDFAEPETMQTETVSTTRTAQTAAPGGLDLRL